MKIILPIVAVIWITAGAAMAQRMSVQIKESPMRSTPSFLGQVTGSVSYGDVVTVLAQRAGWSQVKNASGASGWVHGSALSEKRIVLKGGGAVNSGASSGEVALAGKGFSQQVENQYKLDNATVDFTPVDRMEKRAVGQAALLGFIKQGGLGKGGAQ